MNATWKPQTKKPRREQQVARVRERAADRADRRHLRLGVALGLVAAAGQRAGQQRDERDEAREQQQRGDGAVGADERLAERREQELPERARGGREAHRPRAPLGRHEPGERGQHDRERRAREAEAEQHAAGQAQRGRVRAVRHQHRAGRVHHAARGEHPARAVAVGDRAGERLAEAPHQVLEPDRERERLAVEAAQIDQRVDEQPEARAQPVGDERDQAAGHDDHGRVPAPGHHLNLARPRP